MVEVIISRNPWEDPEEVARVTIEGEVIGETPTAESLRDRIQDERDPIISEYTDGRELLRYLAASYSNGYVMAGYDSEDSRHILEDLSDDAYGRWAKESDFDTEL
ncbi:hypothetical protein C440_06877 [Haloferax mucosum ATCC BAA-1512]|uniref:Uncharacterized protein n=1 Tax=Haloferax mucosum ATCC BAA-1512 TaxID=662479 RepID=M0IG02_9EURY|nr:hypothetical protein [Haloferax mucosum]ELZ94778.1 hypothetical protein C440_06877 [Haloferax mucosum ATCC BAA-1512]